MKNENHDAREWKFMKHGKEIHEGRNGISNIREKERDIMFRHICFTCKEKNISNDYYYLKCEI